MQAVEAGGWGHLVCNFDLSKILGDKSCINHKNWDPLVFKQHPKYTLVPSKEFAETPQRPPPWNLERIG
jgi:hypothetical protein